MARKPGKPKDRKRSMKPKLAGKTGGKVGRVVAEPVIADESELDLDAGDDKSALHDLGAPSEQSKNPESRAKERALNKVPHLRSSPFGEAPGRSAAPGYAKVSFGRGEEAARRVVRRSPSGGGKKKSSGIFRCGGSE